MMDFSRVYKMLDYVDNQPGKFDYGNPHNCLFGIGRGMVPWYQKILQFRPFGNGGDSSFGHWLGLTKGQHWELYCSLGFTARELGWKRPMNTLNRHECVLAAKFVLAKWEGNHVKAMLYALPTEQFVEEVQGETIDA